MIQGFFKEEAELPHKPIPLAIQLIVEDALRASWDKLRKHPPAGFAIATAEEGLQLARSTGQTAMAEKIDDWLKKFRAQPNQSN